MAVDFVENAPITKPIPKGILFSLNGAEVGVPGEGIGGNTLHDRDDALGALS